MAALATMPSASTRTLPVAMTVFVTVAGIAALAVVATFVVTVGDFGALAEATMWAPV